MLLKQRRAIDTFKVQLIPLRTAPTSKIGGPEDVSRLVREMEDYDRESAKIIHLDTKNQVMGIETISTGSLSASIVHPREAVKGAILNNSSSVIFVHNHPSGVCEPSNEDVHITGVLKEAFETVSIALLDSIIVGKGCHYSLRETGLYTPKTEHVMMSGSVREPSQEIKDKVDFINATTEYIKSGSDLERRNRAGEKIKASKYFKPWFEEFFYEHDPQSAKQNLMKFFAANEQGLGVINYTYYGVIQEYLGAISKPVLAVRESSGGRLIPEPEFRIGEHIVKDVENDQFFLKHLLDGKGTPEIAQMIKRIMDHAARYKAVDFKTNVAKAINECLGVEGVPMFRTRYVTPYPPGIVLMVCYGSRGRMHGVWFGNTPDEDIRMLATKTDGYRHLLAKYAQFAPVTAGVVSIGGAGGARFTGQAVVSEAHGRTEVEIKHELGKIFPWRVVYAGTDKTVQTREYPEAMAYYTEREAERGITEEGLTLMPGIPRKPPLETVINSGGSIVDDYGFTWRPVKAPKTKLYLYITVLTEYGGETVSFYEYKFAEWQDKLKKLAKAREKTSFPKRPSTVSENIQNRGFRKSFEKTWDSKDIHNIEAFLKKFTVDTSRYSRANPLPQSLVIGAAIAVDGFLYADHVTDDPDGVMRMLRSSTSVLTEQTTVDDMGSGFYVSGVPEYWRVRSRAKWDFAKNLNRAQRQALMNIILSDPNYRKGGGYLADFEVDYLNRDLKLFVETGDVNVLAMTGSQPYNVSITKEIARKAGVPAPRAPGMVKVKLQGKFINAEGLYFNPEIGNRARDWAGSLEGRKKIAQWSLIVTPKNIVNAWLRSLGYSGAFTKSGFSTNPEMVIWDRKAIIDFRIPEMQT